MLRYAVTAASLALAGCQTVNTAPPGMQRGDGRAAVIGNATLEALGNKDAAACLRQANKAPLPASTARAHGAVGADAADEMTTRRSEAIKAVYLDCMAKRGYAAPQA
ncbi:hypothetical protein AB4099_34325 [Bosea sp. 2KB_26]|uniref:hypothetical protein n=1 Tax=Bosea sp. 2KB_26 TaxID=3237475 RepID=UPI003F92CE1A